MHSVLGWGSFYINFCINEVWQGGIKEPDVAILAIFIACNTIICIVESAFSYRRFENSS